MYFARYIRKIGYKEGIVMYILLRCSKEVAASCVDVDEEKSSRVCPLSSRWIRGPARR
jgi:hypothetical protein